ncbi:MAG TPA: hypothetical protein VHW09_10160 [Bryobacteraceae bacterium]|jgi:hypothetical protein|nr:hypothetical protein [Bryobacteraceae bacterium]
MQVTARKRLGKDFAAVWTKTMNGGRFDLAHAWFGRQEKPYLYLFFSAAFTHA